MSSTLKIYLYASIFGMIILTSSIFFQYMSLKMISDEYYKTYQLYSELYQHHNKLKEENVHLSEILNITINKPECSIRKMAILKYIRWIQRYPPLDLGDPVVVVYVYQDNLTLGLDLIIYESDERLSINLSVQKGDAFDPNYATEEIDNFTLRAPVIWWDQVNKSTSLKITLKERGWYTVSIAGPVSIDGGRDIPGVIWNKKDVIILPLNLQLIIHVYTQEGEQTFFALNEFRKIGFP
ncbi:MAG: hypothetical protein QW486_02650 [Candidatus Bathyarchaeia archaeon]